MNNLENLRELDVKYIYVQFIIYRRMTYTFGNFLNHTIKYPNN